MRQVDIATELNISSGYLSQVLSGQRALTWKLAKGFARIIRHKFPSKTIQAIAGMLMDCAPNELKHALGLSNGAINAS